MSTFFTLWRKEMSGYFVAPIAYVVTIFFLVVMGFSFWMLASVLAQGPVGVSVMKLMFGSVFFWINMMIVVPVLTMRVIAEERRAGTIETLMTAPVTDTQVVLAKYFGVLSFFIIIWLPTIAYMYVLREFSSLMAPIDLRPMLGGYLGAFLVGAFYISLGVFCSSLTSNQIVAAIMSFALISVIFFAGFLGEISTSETIRAVGRHISSASHMDEFSRAMFDTRPVVFYISCTALMLFATVNVIGARRWK